MDLDRPTFADCVNGFVRLALEIHLIDPAAEHAGDVGDHRLLVGAEFRTLADHGDVEIDRRPPG